ncbi:quinoprotein dehydrogenase-associated putative ABC transporter substrate-binding protein [Salinisphaera sp.]|uniref:quinoprotein dehydrogenase-associated putative ABC transporter substrate-binding protein n=1 Tax=Salinisphaera sp. TaxID=1914330 RepID=UPI000C6ACE1B|nr:quinoprotein dehydrogenase-associated putative ABC transporter substrate-binding protein [Salinisphaera sp.]MBS62666.1 ABC transporter substrate-binding protein [Salinisphaera sp.]
MNTHTRFSYRLGRTALATLLALGVALPALAQRSRTVENPAAEALRVCADPSNMPFSNEAGEGFENRIANLFGEQLGVPVEYTWMPEQMGFGRNTLKRWLPDENRYACDLIISVGSAFEVGKTTRPYYRSTYTLAYLKGHGLDTIERPDDLLDLPQAQRDDLRIGVFTGSPAGDWIIQHGMIGQIVSYRAQSGGYDVDPADMVAKDLVNGDIDIAVVWGPIAGYYAEKIDTADIAVVPFTREDGPTFDFPVSMGVRYGNDQWLHTVQQLIDDNHAAIDAILDDYGVPRVPLREVDRQVQEDDDD